MGIFPTIHYVPSQYGRNNFFENFNISENNIISVKLAKVILLTTNEVTFKLKYNTLFRRLCHRMW